MDVQIKLNKKSEKIRLIVPERAGSGVMITSELDLHDALSLRDELGRLISELRRWMSEVTIDGEGKMRVIVRSIADRNRLRVDLHETNGMPYARVSDNLPHENVAKNEVFVRTDRYDNIVLELVDQGFMVATDYISESGFCTYRKYELTPKALSLL